MMNFFDRLQQIDHVIMAGASRHAVEQLRALMQEDASRRYAFERIDAKWFPFLHEGGWFREIPAL